MSNNRNYSKELEKRIEEFQKNGVYPKLLLHACCAPCSSYCLEYLRQYFDVTVFFYNPNITEENEYRKRVAEEKRLIEAYNDQVKSGNFEGMNSDKNARLIKIMEGDYRPSDFYEAAKGYEDCKEGGERCKRCFELRLTETAKAALENGFEFFTTTLTISPLKNADVLNEVGERACKKVLGEMADSVQSYKSSTESYQSDEKNPGPEQNEYQFKKLEFLPSDFKKKNGYKRSIELSSMFCLYRQDFCGCSFSKAQREREKESRMNL